MKKKVLAIMLIAMSIMLISACGKKRKTVRKFPDLSQYKTDYVRRFFKCYKYCKWSRVSGGILI